MNDNEMMAAIISAVVQQSMKQQGKQNASITPPFNFNTGDMAKKSASTAKQLYDAYVEVGFTKEQAFELVKGILTAKKN